MTPERWQQIDKLLEEALELEASKRAAFLDQACAGDEALSRKVEDLLAAHGRAESFIETPALEVAAQAMAEQARSMVGRQLGHYQILALLGKGGMGEVYRARDTRIGREVAIKVLPAVYSRDAERLRRFEQEARAAGMLNHPNILVVHDIGSASPESGGAPYIVSELLEGETLRARLNGSALTPRKAIDYALKSPSHWSRDGRFIIYQQTDPKTKRDVWVLPVTGDRKPFAFLQTPANEEEGRLSPDGRWMAYVSDESGRYEVYVQSFLSGGGKRQVSTGGGIAAQWRGDGKELFYHTPDGKLMAVEVRSGATFEVVATKPLFEFRAIGSVGTYPSYTATADGQRFMISTLVGNESSAPLTVVVNWAAALKR